jgi:hypothetical protein
MIAGLQSCASYRGANSAMRSLAVLAIAKPGVDVERVDRRKDADPARRR